MLSLLILSLLWGAWRVTTAALASLRDLPRSNEDMVFF